MPSDYIFRSASSQNTQTSNILPAQFSSLVATTKQASTVVGGFESSFSVDRPHTSQEVYFSKPSVFLRHEQPSGTASVRMENSLISISEQGYDQMSMPMKNEKFLQQNTSPAQRSTAVRNSPSQQTNSYKECEQFGTMTPLKRMKVARKLMLCTTDKLLRNKGKRKSPQSRLQRSIETPDRSNYLLQSKEQSPGQYSVQSFNERITIQRKGLFQTTQEDRCKMTNVNILVNTKTNKIFEAFSRETRPTTATLISAKNTPQTSQNVTTGPQPDYDKQSLSVDSSDSEDDTKDGGDKVTQCSQTQSERMHQLTKHLAYGQLHKFDELVLNEGSLGAVEHRIAHDHLTGDEVKSIKKFVKRQGRPSTGIPFRPIFNGTEPGQFQINKKNLQKVKSKVGEITKGVGMYEMHKKWLQQRDKGSKDPGSLFNNATDVVLETKGFDSKREMVLDLELQQDEEPNQNLYGQFGAGLRSPHHLLKGIVQFNTNKLMADVKETCFGQDYDIATKATAYKVLRDTGGRDKSVEVRKQKYELEREFNKRCRMLQSKHIDQIIQNIQKPKVRVTNGKIQKMTTEIYADRMRQLAEHIHDVKKTKMGFHVFGNTNPKRTRCTVSEYKNQKLMKEQAEEAALNEKNKPTTYIDEAGQMKYLHWRDFMNANVRKEHINRLQAHLQQAEKNDQMM